MDKNNVVLVYVFELSPFDDTIRFYFVEESFSRF